MQNKFLLLSEKTSEDILSYLPNSKTVQNLAVFFQNFSDSTRLKILMCLSLSDLCVNDISVLLGLKQTTISHQLKILRSENIIENHRVGKVVIYSLKKQTVNDIMMFAVKNIA